MLKSENIFLRTPQSVDVSTLLNWENNPDNWEVSGTKKPFTKAEIKTFVYSNHDLIENGQIRYMICLNKSEQAIGTIDLFEYNHRKRTVGVGVLIAENTNRRKGYASETLKLIVNHCRNELGVVNLFCNISKDNDASIRLFENCGFRFVEKQKLFEKEVNCYELKV